MKNQFENIVLSAACGLKPGSINFFLMSLRKFYNGKVLFLVNPNDYELKKTIKSYNCDFLEISDHKFDVQIQRYFHFLEFLKANKFNNILLCDSRDIYFQANPFDYQYSGCINYFLESKKIGDCEYNSNWIKKTYGQNIFKRLSNETIVCSGTTLGSLDCIKSYLELVLTQAKKFKYKKKLKYLITFRRDKEGRGCDQAYSNFIAHSNLIEKSHFYKNESGPIATVYNLKKIVFNNKFQLINSMNEPYAVVHQYDKRWNEFENKIKNFKNSII